MIRALRLMTQSASHGLMAVVVYFGSIGVCGTPGEGSIPFGRPMDKKLQKIEKQFGDFMDGYRFIL